MGTGTLRLTQIFGIRIGVSRTWFLVLFVVIYVLNGYFGDILASGTAAFLVAVAAALLFFATVVAHELGHAVAARRMGMHVEGIDLWALGGFMRARGEPETPMAELRLAAAGPAVNALIVVICIAIGLAFGSFRHFIDVALLESGLKVGPALVLLSWLALINTVLLVFNLLPALPLDGGRIARAIAWQVTGDANRATRGCARVGQVLGAAMIAGGLLLVLRSYGGYGLWFILIGFFITQAARQAWLQGRLGERMQRLTVGEVMDPDPLTIPSWTRLLDAKEQYFSADGIGWLPVTDDDGRYRGLLLAARVEEELRDGRPALTAGDVSIDSPPWRVDASATLETALRSEGLRRLGAVVAVDGDGILRGILTLPIIRRAMHSSSAI